MAKEDPEDEMEELGVRLERLFVSFCTFGVAKDAVALMDGTKFTKFCKDMGLVGKNLTVTDVDIIFAQSKPKTERKINFHHFQVTLELIAKKKYGEDDPDALNKLHQTMKLYRGPRNSSGVNSADIPDSPVVARMTDTSKYTGTHKMRFDEEGKGKGLAGRDSPAKGKGKTPSVAAQEPYVQGFKPSPKLSSSPSTKKNASSPSTSKKPASSPSVSKKPASSPIVARLTDTSKYTGTHKLRFDGQGRGKGLAGRDPPSKGGSPQLLVGSHAAYVQGYKHEGTYGKK